MSLIKWSGGGNDDRQELVKWVRELADKKEQAVGKREIVQTELVRRGGVPCPSFSTASVVTNAPPVLHLPRWCAVHDAVWLAMYNGGNGGRYGFNGSYALTPQYQSQYAPENLIALPDDFKADSEQCGCCGMWTPHREIGSIWCPVCRAYVCWGNTSPGGYFVCRPRCGFEGQSVVGRCPEKGFIMGRNF